MLLLNQGWNIGFTYTSRCNCQGYAYAYAHGYKIHTERKFITFAQIIDRLSAGQLSIIDLFISLFITEFNKLSNESYKQQNHRWINTRKQLQLSLIFVAVFLTIFSFTSWIDEHYSANYLHRLIVKNGLYQL